MNKFLFPVFGFGVMLASTAQAVEGWMVQPTLHGDSVVFASEGDLWVANIADLTADRISAYRLTSGTGIESRPIFSPDGRKVAFLGEYDGNRDVYIMPLEGGGPTRLTFHPASDTPIGFTPDGRHVVFRSGRSNPMGNAEAFRVPVTGGLPEPLGFGDCTQIDYSSTGRQVAFTPYSNEDWNWRNYRGGTAPDIWIGIPEAGDFTNVTLDEANDLFPMWMGGRITFLSDRSGAPNLFSMRPDGSELKQHTDFKNQPDDPTAWAGYELRWPSRDRARGGDRVIFSQGGSIAVLDPSKDELRRLPIHMVSDRARTRIRTEDAMQALDGFIVSPMGDRMLMEARGELLLVPILDVDDESITMGSPRQITKSASSRERNAAWIDNKSILLISDINGEQQIARLLVDEPGKPFLLTDDREDWLLSLKVSPDGRWAAFSDRTGRLQLLGLENFEIIGVTRSKVGELTDFEFSPDGEWLVYSNPLASGMSSIELYSIRTGRVIPLSSGLTSDHSPRFSMDGSHLFFFSDRHLDPILGNRDFEHVFLRSTEVLVVPLTREGIPPLPEAIELADGFQEDSFEDIGEELEPVEMAEPEIDRIRIDPEGMMSRAVRLPIPPGSYELLQPLPGGLLLLDRPVMGLLEEVWPEPVLGAANGTLLHYDLSTASLEVVAEDVSDVSVAALAPVAVVHGLNGFGYLDLDMPGGSPIPMALEEVPMLVDVSLEWAQIFDEAWRLQRDFYWAPNMGGVDWNAMKVKYAARLSRIGNRAELNILIGEMLAELGVSHAYIWGGDDRNQAESVDVGLLGADLVPASGGIRITNRLSAPDWSGLDDGPVAPDWIGVPENAVLRSIDGQSLGSGGNPYALLQGKANKAVTLGIEEEPGSGVRMVRVRPIADEQVLRYANWVEGNRQAVSEATNGRVGYLHLPDMDGEGLSMFGRLFYPQVDKEAMLIDVRGNGGGFVSQMIISRLARKPWAYSKARHGVMETYPWRVLDGPVAVLIDQHAGSDGDIFPESFRLLDMGPLIGTRTWGGVIGIRADKPSVDGGVTTQPEYAWWEPTRGWSLENSGVTPDIEVLFTPADRQEGRDPQLERGIRELQDVLAESPRKKPQPPPYPGE